MNTQELELLWEKGYENVMERTSHEYKKELTLDGQTIMFTLEDDQVYLDKNGRMPDLIDIDPNNEKSVSCQTKDEFLDRVQTAVDSNW